jgi:hypothetical protein
MMMCARGDGGSGCRERGNNWYASAVRSVADATRLLGGICDTRKVKNNYKRLLAQNPFIQSIAFRRLHAPTLISSSA